MRLLAERCTTIVENNALKIPHMGVANRRGDATIGDDAPKNQGLDASALQHPFQPALKER